MKHLFTLLVVLTTLTASCSVEQRLEKLIHTNEVYYIDSEMYQVFINSRGKRFIILPNKKQTNFKKRYLKLKEDK